MMKQQMMEIGWLFDLSIKSKSKADAQFVSLNF
jgi:hypothetical protein